MATTLTEFVTPSHFDDAVDEIVGTSSSKLLDRAIAFLQYTSNKISSAAFGKLHALIRPDTIIDARPSYWSDLTVLVKRLDPDSALPKSDALDCMQAVVQ
jgi:hypothetical protein